MSHIAKTISHLASQASPYRYLGLSSSNTLRQIADPGSITAEKLGNGAPLTAGNVLDPGGWFKKPEVPAVPQAPTLDTAQQGAVQQQDLMRRRRGVLANIFAGSNPNPPAATVGQKQLLGT